MSEAGQDAGLPAPKPENQGLKPPTPEQEKRGLFGLFGKKNAPANSPLSPVAASAEQDQQAKVEIDAIPGTDTLHDRQVRLRINGEDPCPGVVWKQYRDRKAFDGSHDNGQFFLVDIAKAKGNLKIPSGVRFTIYTRRPIPESFVNITGGENTGIDIKDIKDLKDKGAEFYFETKDSEFWNFHSGLSDKEAGKSSFYTDLLGGSTTYGLSVPVAIERFQKTLERSKLNSGVA